MLNIYYEWKAARIKRKAAVAMASIDRHLNEAEAALCRAQKAHRGTTNARAELQTLKLARLRAELDVAEAMGIPFDLVKGAAE